MLGASLWETISWYVRHLYEFGFTQCKSLFFGTETFIIFLNCVFTAIQLSDIRELATALYILLWHWILSFLLFK